MTRLAVATHQQRQVVGGSTGPLSEPLPVFGRQAQHVVSEVHAADFIKPLKVAQAPLAECSFIAMISQRKVRLVDTNEIRRENARLLADQCGGVRRFAERIDRSESQASQIIGRTPTRNIGPAVARRLERIFDKPHGWLDVPHGLEAQGVREDAAQYTLTLSPDALTIAEKWMQLPEELRSIVGGFIDHYLALSAKMPEVADAMFRPPKGKRQREHEKRIELYQVRKRRREPRK